jgi:hypothetical protein
MTAKRWSAWLAGLWAGLLWGVGLIGAPAGFATMDPAAAGRVAGRMFGQEAYLGLILAIVLFVLLRKIAREAASAGAGSVFSGNMLLVLGALFTIVLGYFALQPMMAAAKAGQDGLSFGALHGISAGLYMLRAVLVSILAWRLAA